MNLLPLFSKWNTLLFFSEVGSSIHLRNVIDEHCKPLLYTMCHFWCMKCISKLYKPFFCSAQNLIKWLFIETYHVCLFKKKNLKTEIKQWRGWVRWRGWIGGAVCFVRNEMRIRGGRAFVMLCYLNEICLRSVKSNKFETQFLHCAFRRIFSWIFCCICYSNIISLSPLGQRTWLIDWLIRRVLRIHKFVLLSYRINSSIKISGLWIDIWTQNRLSCTH
jgi:hypothetical protein